MSSPRPRVAYFYDPDIGSYSYGLQHPMKPLRIRMVHDLVGSYGMLDKMQILRPKRASPRSMTAFHTDEYIHFLHSVTPETENEMTGYGQRFLVGADNPYFDGLFEFCSISAGGSIAAAEWLNNGASDITINWAGGLHHAKRREASGFCYVNDIVLGILELLRVFPRVLYIDIDVHHGDGVEEAFYSTDRVLTVSFHKFGTFFPGTGHLSDRGRGKGAGYSVNVPLRDGLTDAGFSSVFEPVMQGIIDWYRPNAVVLQCGADSLAGDKLGCFNLSMEGHASSVLFMKKFGVPLMILGGGGYTVKNVARLWTYETACALGVQDSLSRDLPYHECFEWFGPRYRLEVLPSNMEDGNEANGYLDKVKTEVLQNLRELPFAPSVGMQEVPSESLGEHLRLEVFEENPYGSDDDISDMDETITHLVRNALKTDEPTSDSDEEVWPDGNNLDESSRYPHRRRKRYRPTQANGYTHNPISPRAPSFYSQYRIPARPPKTKRRFFRRVVMPSYEEEIELKQRAGNLRNGGLLDPIIQVANEHGEYEDVVVDPDDWGEESS